MVDNTILERITKLLALSESSNEHEAAAAATKAAELLQRHNLELSDVQVYQANKPDDDKVTQGHAHKTFKRDNVESEWISTLAEAIASSCMCKALYGRYYVSFVGRAREVEVAKHMFTTLSTKLESLVIDAVRAYAEQFKAEHGVSPYRGGSYGSAHPIAYRKSWLEGAADGISSQLYERRRTFQKEQSIQGTTGQALMVIRDQEITEYLKDRKIKTFTPRSSLHNYNAYAAGEHTGRNMALGGELESGTTKRIKG